METWYEIIQYERPMFCEKCGVLIARRASLSPVVDLNGNPIEANAVVLDYDPRADYELTCPCGHATEFSSPEDAAQLKATSFDKCTAPEVTRLT